ncbi:MAG: protein kinase [Methylomonas sp.]|jgi:serine/threonine protein kinase|uniref:protein kinase domain-containing protein n=1 Tax=Methylomonas sp. TaxID=418 RepID=UPI0025D557A2|nr:protein kinase [Methylomonas sp.]MCK9607822.1 protein kinase [Methylomonas sp.]
MATEKSDNMSRELTAIIPSIQIHRKIGAGAFCDVYAARLAEDKVAVKYYMNSTFSFENERRVLAHLNHDNIAKIRQSGYIAGDVMSLDDRHYNPPIPYFIMPRYYQSISTLVREYQKANKNEMPAHELVAHISRQLFNALKYLRKSGVIHADIKPSNVLLTVPISECTRLEDFHIVLCDFGSSSLLDTSAQEKSADHAQQELPRPACMHVGTMPYISPEILLGRRYSFETDIWSAMLVVFVLLFGEDLFDVFNDSNLDYFDNDYIKGIFIKEESEHDSEFDEHSQSEKSENDGGKSAKHSRSEKNSTRGSAEGLAEGSADSEDSSMDDESSSKTADISFDELYAHFVLFYKFLGTPPDEMLNNELRNLFDNGLPRYHQRIKRVTLSEFIRRNYTLLDANLARIVDFLQMGLKYDYTVRATPDEILSSDFINGAAELPVAVVAAASASASQSKSYSKKRKAKH